MQPIFYDVAVSADGFISGPFDDVSSFPHSGSVVDDYKARLASYRHCLMGRRTYEFAYDYGLKCGENPYPSLQTLVFSTSINLPQHSDVEHVFENSMKYTEQLRRSADGPIYLCGGGDFAGQLVSAGLIDFLRLKRAPILLGSGTRLFGDHCQPIAMTLTSSKSHENGVFYQEFEITPSP